jgi:putative endonuclease
LRNNLNKKKGTQNEEIAISFLKELGFEIIERNYYAKKLGEIDIIALHNGVWHFIEVKSSQADFDPIYNLTPIKLKRVINSTHYYLKKNKLDVVFCIDLIVIREGEVEFLENITL